MEKGNYEQFIAGMTGAYAYCKILLDKNNNPEDFIILVINRSFEKLFALKENDILNKKASEVISWIGHPIIINCSKTAITGENAEIEHFIAENNKWMRLNLSSHEKLYFSIVITDITEFKKLEKERAEQTLSLSQHVKEMNLIVELSQLMQKQDLTLDLFLNETVKLIPSAFRYPEITFGRISFRNKSFFSVGCARTSSWILSEEIKIRGELSGSIEVCYIENTEEMDKGPFLQDELRLINTLARYVEKIIEKLEADENLRLTKIKLQQYMEHAPEGIFIADIMGRFIEVNPAACRLLQYSQEELLKLSVADIMHAALEGEGVAGFIKLYETGKYRSEKILIKKDRGHVFVDLDSVKLPDGTFMAFCKDITDKKEAEKQLAEMASFHKTLLDTIPAPVYYKNTDGRFLGINKKFREYFSPDQNQIVGKFASDLTTPELAKIYAEKDEELYKNKVPQVYESRIMDYRGNMHDAVIYKDIYKNSKNNPDGIIGVILDITELKKYQNDLELYFKAIQSVEQPVIITEKNGDIIEVNSAFEKVYGYSKENVKKQNPRLLNPGRNVYRNFGYTDEKYDELFGKLWRDIKNPAIGTWEDIIINKKKDGSLIWIKLIINAVYGKNGDLLYFIALPIDISRSIHHENMTKIQLYQMIASLSELRDNETGNHMRRVGLFAKLLAIADKKSEKYCNDIEIFSQLHDIGKVGILDSILLSENKLSIDEMKIMQTHTIQGYNIVKGVKEMEMAAAITLSHHEKYDGTGYPHYLKKEDIPLSARITSIADVYDSLRSKRPYKQAWQHEDAKNYIFENAGTFFDPRLVDHFSNLENKFEIIYNDLSK